MVPYIEFRNVTFLYTEKEVLHDINFSVYEGDFVCIIGGSGSGKTTLLKLISGEIYPKKGEVLIKGKSISDFSKAELHKYRKSMGYLFQQGALFTDLNVYDNVAFPIREHTSLCEKEIEAIVENKLLSVDLGGVERLYPAELSGGMIKRVALARAIALNPSLLLYDEPFAGLDPIVLMKIAKLIGRTNQNINATSIMVTHNIRESLPLADKVILLSQNRIVFDGSPEDILKNRNSIVQEFLRAASIPLALLDVGS
ncbi:MAG: ATP-binding cassette domain-containing protein [Neisseriaceae bacterium]|nr:MAG: ATP-binding cassette domain-containing protein [Neisseriaceae bacterium]